MPLYRYRCYEYSVEAANTSDLREDGRLRSSIWSGFSKIDSRREGKRNQERRKGGRQRHRAGNFRYCMGNLRKGVPEGMPPLSSNSSDCSILNISPKTSQLLSYTGSHIYVCVCVCVCVLVCMYVCSLDG